LIEVPIINWISAEWMNTIWIMFVIMYGVTSGLLFFSMYFIIRGVLETMPINLLEVIFSGNTSAPSPYFDPPKTDPKLSRTN
jgi:hypothetical protein